MELKTTKEIAHNYRIAEVRVHEAIFHHGITRHIQYGRVVVSPEEFRTFAKNNPEIIENWQNVLEQSMRV